jgi:hypothetical protein
MFVSAKRREATDGVKRVAADASLLRHTASRGLVLIPRIYCSIRFSDDRVGLLNRSLARNYTGPLKATFIQHSEVQLHRTPSRAFGITHYFRALR